MLLPNDMSSKKTDSQKINESIENESFEPCCSRNVDCIVNLWYECLFEKIDAHVSRATRHHAAAQHWISGSMSHLIKRLNMINGKHNSSLSSVLKKEKLEKQIS